jgi:hypothetical protein
MLYQLISTSYGFLSYKIIKLGAFCIQQFNFIYENKTETYWTIMSSF